MKIVEFTLEEVRRQRKSLKDVSRTAGLDKDTMYRWRDGRIVSLYSLARVLNVLGYELSALPAHTPLDLIKE